MFACGPMSHMYGTGVTLTFLILYFIAVSVKVQLLLLGSHRTWHSCWCYHSIAVNFSYVTSSWETIITPHVTVEYSGASTKNYDCYNGSHLNTASSNFELVWCGSATTTDAEGPNKRCCWPHHCDIAVCHQSSFEFSFSMFSLPPVPWISVCYGVCILLSGSNMDATLATGNSNTGISLHSPFKVYPRQANVHFGAGLWPMPKGH